MSRSPTGVPARPAGGSRWPPTSRSWSVSLQLLGCPRPRAAEDLHAGDRRRRRHRRDHRDCGLVLPWRPRGWIAVSAACLAALGAAADRRCALGARLRGPRGRQPAWRWPLAGVSPTIDAVVFGLMMPMAPWRPARGARVIVAPGPTPSSGSSTCPPLVGLCGVAAVRPRQRRYPARREAIRHAVTDPIAVGVAFGSGRRQAGRRLGRDLARGGARARLAAGRAAAGSTWRCGAALAGIGFTVAIFMHACLLGHRADRLALFGPDRLVLGR